MKRFFCAAVVGMSMLLLVGCGKEIALTINDSDIKTEIIAKTGQTVDAVLKEAEIAVGEKDEVTPSLDSKLSETDTKIDIVRMVNVTVVNDGQECKLEMLGGTVGEAIEKAGITLGELDYVDAELDKKLQDGMTVNITKQAKVVVKVDGQTIEVVTSEKTVADLLSAYNISLGNDDIISCDVASEITSGMEIVINRVEIKEVQETEEIPFETESQKSNNIAKGKTSVKQEGVNGEKLLTYKITYVDGVEKDRELLSEEVVKEPVNKIVVTGTKTAKNNTKKVVKTEYFDDCDGSGHGYKIIYYSDGTTKEVSY